MRSVGNLKLSLKEKKMIAVNRDGLKAEYRSTIEYVEKLETFLQDVSLAKPLLSFSVDDQCVTNERKKDANGDITHEKMLYRIKVYGAGEELGSIGIVDRWRGGITEKAYMVECFRINKHRGRGNTTTSIDVKLALREAKRAFNPREDSELKNLIHDNIKRSLDSLMSNSRSYLRWNFDQDEALCILAANSYEARKNGEAFAKIPSTPATVKDIKQHDKLCENYINAKVLHTAITSKMGYGIRANLDNTLVIYNFITDTVSKVNSLAELPEAIHSKFAMFKVLEVNEAVNSIGVKFDDNYFYIMP